MSLYCAVALTSAFGFVACNDEDEMSKGSSMTSYFAGTTQYKSVSNSDNPFEYVGETHNSILHDMAHYQSPERLTDSILYNYAVNNNSIDTTEVSIEEYLQCMHNISRFTDRYLNDSLEILSVIGIADRDVIPYINAYRRVVVDFMRRDTLVTPEEFAQEIKSIESTILQNELYDTSDVYNSFSTVLIGLSVARHSYSYWYDAYNDISHPWYNKVHKAIDKESMKKGLFSWVGKVFSSGAADVVGAFSSLFGSHKKTSVSWWLQFHFNVSFEAIKNFCHNTAHASANRWNDLTDAGW